MHATIGAYSEEGREWVNELMRVIEGNVRWAYEYVCENLPGVKTGIGEGTYMMFLDLTEYCETSGRSIDEMIEAGWKVGIGWQNGRSFEGPCHVRLNLGSPRWLIEEAFDRMKKYVFV